MGAVKGIRLRLEPLPDILKAVIAAAARAPDDSERYAHVPSALETQLMPFQREGVRFVLRHGGRALIGDEMVGAGLLAAGWVAGWPPTAVLLLLRLVLRALATVGRRLSLSRPVLWPRRVWAKPCRRWRLRRRTGTSGRSSSSRPPPSEVPRGPACWPPPFLTLSLRHAALRDPHCPIRTALSPIQFAPLFPPQRFCPRAEQWADAVHRWLGVTEDRVQIVHSNKDAEAPRPPGLQFLIISYNFVPKMVREG